MADDYAVQILHAVAASKVLARGGWRVVTALSDTFGNPLVVIAATNKLPMDPMRRNDGIS